MRKTTQQTRKYIAEMAQRNDQSVMTYSTIASALSVPPSGPYFVLRALAKEGAVEPIRQGRIKGYRVVSGNRWWETVLGNSSFAPPIEANPTRQAAAKAKPLSEEKLNASWEDALKETEQNPLS
jgi:hypothetical protein